jgi:hypothetical protein
VGGQQQDKKDYQSGQMILYFHYDSYFSQKKENSVI